MKRRTLRGLLDTSEQRRLIVDDGRLNHGYRVVSFVVFPYAPAGATQQTPVTLGLDYDMGPNMDASDNRQIGWAITVYGSGSLEAIPNSVIDPDHIVIQDLYIRNENSVDQVNYLIELEPVELTNDQAILTLIKERSQDDLR
jgi:hypothetical protein